jgi:hypothetical protein
MVDNGPTIAAFASASGLEAVPIKARFLIPCVMDASLKKQKAMWKFQSSMPGWPVLWQ